MTRRTRIILAVSALMLIVSAAALVASPEPQYTKRCTVKLYSANGTIATWDAMGMGQVEGQTLIFTVGSEVSPRKVRISGTWSIEERD